MSQEAGERLESASPTGQVRLRSLLRTIAALVATGHEGVLNDTSGPVDAPTNAVFVFQNQ